MRRLPTGAWRSDTDIADEHVDAVPFVGHRGDCGVHPVFVGDVHRHGERLAAAVGDLIGDRLGRVLIQVGDGDSCAFAREAQGDFSSDAARGTGDDADLVTQIHS
jgi:hypothetical protein